MWLEFGSSYSSVEVATVLWKWLRYRSNMRTTPFQENMSNRQRETGSRQEVGRDPLGPLKKEMHRQPHEFVGHHGLGRPGMLVSSLARSPILGTKFLRMSGLGSRYLENRPDSKISQNL